MDYNFNINHPSQRSLKMFLQPPSFGQRHFSTCSNININQCLSRKQLSADPLHNFICGFSKQKTNKQKLTRVKSSPAKMFSSTTGMPVTPLPFDSYSSSSMSVSYWFGGLVSDDNRMKKPQQHCGELLLDLLNEFSPFANASQSTVHGNIPESVKKEPPPKRTYAEVTKEKPKPLPQTSATQVPPVNRIKTSSAISMNNIRSVVTPIELSSKENNCDNLTVLSQSSFVGLTPLCQDCIKDKLFDMAKVCCGEFNRLKSCSTSSDSSIEPDKSISRTLSECSVESDDSFIIFQNDDEGAICDYSGDESSEDDDDDVPNLVPICKAKTEKSTDKGVSPSTKKKMVRWKEDKDLVKVHRLVKWDYASRAARIGHWEQFVWDRARFRTRIREVSLVISPILDPAHRQAVFSERFS